MLFPLPAFLSFLYVNERQKNKIVKPRMRMLISFHSVNKRFVDFICFFGILKSSIFRSFSVSNYKQKYTRASEAFAPYTITFQSVVVNNCIHALFLHSQCSNSCQRYGSGQA